MRPLPGGAALRSQGLCGRAGAGPTPGRGPRAQPRPWAPRCPRGEPAVCPGTAARPPRTKAKSPENAQRGAGRGRGAQTGTGTRSPSAGQRRCHHRCALPCSVNTRQGFSCLRFPWSPPGTSQQKRMADVFMASLLRVSHFCSELPGGVFSDP